MKTLCCFLVCCVSAMVLLVPVHAGAQTLSAGFETSLTGLSNIGFVRIGLVSDVPEPASLVLFALGGLFTLRRRTA